MGYLTLWQHYFFWAVNMEIPAFARLSEHESAVINYLCNIRSQTNYNLTYLEDLKLIVLRNCHEDGTLVDLKQTAKKSAALPPWLLLTLHYVEPPSKKFTSAIWLIQVLKEPLGSV